jgi:uncharacterized protein involved in outer membrane biogenesis
MRALKLAGAIVAGILLIVILVSAAVAIGGAPVVRWAIEHPLSRFAGRQIGIDGPLTIEWGAAMRIVAQGVHVANTNWGSRPEMFAAQRVEIDFFPSSLFKGTYHFPLISVEHAQLLLETARDGERNWDFALKFGVPGGEGQFPELNQFGARDSVFIFHNGGTGAETQIVVDDLSLSAADTSAPVKFAAAGTFQRLPGRFAGTLGAVADLRQSAKPYPVTLEGNFGDSLITIEGALAQPLDLAGVDVRLSWSGRNLRDIAEALSVPLPSLPDFRATAVLNGGGDDWRLKISSLHLGHSNLAGELAINAKGKTPYLRAALTSSLIDIADFIGFLGVNTPASPERSEQSSPGHRIIPATPIRVKELLGVDADLELSLDAKRLAATIGPPLDRLSATLHLKGGVLTFNPLSFGVAGGTVAINMSLNSDSQPAKLAFALDVSHVDLHRLAMDPQVPQVLKQTRGIAGGFVHFQSTGTSLREFLGRMNGEAGLFAADGQFNQVLEQITDLNVLQAVGLAGSGDRPMTVGCLASRFDLKNGVATATAFILDTDDSTLVGAGNFNFGAETMSVDLTPHHKHFNPLVLRSPVELRGSFATPHIDVSRVSILQQLGAAMGRSLLMPPAGPLLPLIDTGLGQNNACHHIFATQSPEEPTAGSSQRPVGKR